jgi:hypothetical protein
MAVPGLFFIYLMAESTLPLKLSTPRNVVTGVIRIIQDTREI